MHAPEERTAEKDAAWIVALERERDNYLAAGRDDRAAEVQAEIDRVTGNTAKARPPRKQASTRLRNTGAEER
jgi:hypothetical protein